MEPQPLDRHEAQCLAASLRRAGARRLLGALAHGWQRGAGPAAEAVRGPRDVDLAGLSGPEVFDFAAVSGLPVRCGSRGEFCAVRCSADESDEDADALHLASRGGPQGRALVVERGDCAGRCPLALDPFVPSCALRDPRGQPAGVADVAGMFPKKYVAYVFTSFGAW